MQVFLHGVQEFMHVCGFKSIANQRWPAGGQRREITNGEQTVVCSANFMLMMTCGTIEFSGCGISKRQGRYFGLV